MVNWGIPEKILHGFVYCEKFSFLLVWRRLQMSCKMTGDHRERLHERIWVKWVSKIGTSGREVTDKLGILTLGVEQLSKYFTPSSNRVTLATIGVKQLQMLYIYSLSVWRLPWREFATISYVQMHTTLQINKSHRNPIFYILIIWCHLSILYRHLQIVNQ